jgi:type VI secretion system secreted protein Hcp
VSGTIRLHVTSRAIGAVRGDGPEGAIECVGFESGVTAVRAARQGLATGRRTHSPIVVRKRVDRASPLLLQAVCTNDLLEARFDFLRPEAPSVSSAVFYTVTLFEARIVSVRQLVTEPAPAARSVGSTPMEELSLEFQRSGGPTSKRTPSSRTRPGTDGSLARVS